MNFDTFSVAAMAAELRDTLNEGRVQEVTHSEREWKQEVYRQQSRRRVGAYINVIIGGVVTAGAIALAVAVPYLTDEPEYWVANYLSAGMFGTLGLILVSAGIWRFFNLSPLEEAWRVVQGELTPGAVPPGPGG